VEVGFWITIFLCKTKINNIDLVASFADTHQEIVWFDITMYKRFCMDVFDSGDLGVGISVSKSLTRPTDVRQYPTYQLIGQQEDGF